MSFSAFAPPPRKDFVLAKESNTAVRCSFMVQTLFTEFTWQRPPPLPDSKAEGGGEPPPFPAGWRVRCFDELSQPGPSATFTTRNLTDDERRGAYGIAAAADAGAVGGGGAAGAGQATTTKVAKKFKQAILLDSGVTMHVNGPYEVSVDQGAGESAI